MHGTRTDIHAISELHTPHRYDASEECFSCLQRFYGDGNLVVVSQQSKRSCFRQGIYPEVHRSQQNDSTQ